LSTFLYIELQKTQVGLLPNMGLLPDEYGTCLKIIMYTVKKISHVNFMCKIHVKYVPVYI